VSLNAGDVSTGNDFLDTLPVTIGNLVWMDNNRNGVQDANEPGVPGVTVNLLDASGNVVATTTTAADGTYMFTVMPGEYSVQFDTATLPANTVITVAGNGAENVNSDADQNGMTRTTGILLAGDSDLDLDMGIYNQLAGFGDTVWVDLNNNGLHDEPLNDNGLVGVDVNVYTVDADGNETLVDTTTTGPNGFYQFVDLPAGDYLVRVDQDDIDRDAYPLSSTPMMWNITLLPGEFNADVDFGVLPNVTAIDLLAFSATKSAAGVSVQWTTASETGTLGFNLYRSAGIDGARVQIGSLIVAQNSLNGANYTQNDSSALADGTYYYWLNEIDLSAKSTEYGPAAVTIGAPKALKNLVAEVPGIIKLDEDYSQFKAAQVNGEDVATLALADGLVIFVAEAGAEVTILENADALRMTVADALPADEAPTHIVATEGVLNFTASADIQSYFLKGFASEPIVLNVDDVRKPVVLSGQPYELEDGSAGVHVKSPGNVNVEAAELD